MSLKTRISFILFNILLFTAFQGCHNNTPKATFEVITRGLPDTSNVYVTGNNEQLGSWSPGSVKLERKNDSLWSAEIPFNLGDTIEFKFTLGSWESEALTDAGVLPMNYTAVINEDTTLRYEINNWLDPADLPPGKVTGQIITHEDFDFGELESRDIYVWLPPDYDKDKNKRYPVLYMHDGQNLFDATKSGMRMEWHIDETADSLVKAGEIKPIIIVGIANTPARGDEYIYGETGSDYLNAVKNGVKNFIDDNYRTKSGRENTAIGGSSAGGLSAFMMVWEYPDVFSRALCFSPALKIRGLDYVSLAEKKQTPEDVKIYIYNGGIELEAELQPGIDDMVELMKEKGLNEGEDFIFRVNPEAAHSENAWAAELPEALKYLFGRKR